jgi:ABC-type cobalt transport system substrate-binding protein
LGQNINNTATGSVSDGTYVGFIILMFLGAVIGLFLCNAGRIQRHDGSKVIVMKNPTWMTEFKGLWETISQEPWIVLLFPLFWSSNTFYTYQMNVMNHAYFNVRTRALNNLLYWLSQIVGAMIFGYALDFGTARRTVRAKGSFVALTVLTFVIWGGGYAFQSKMAPREIATAKGFPTADWTDGGDAYIGPMFLYMFYGFFDAAWQTCIYW